jgi:hypothetical protein
MMLSWQCMAEAEDGLQLAAISTFLGSKRIVT